MILKEKGSILYKRMGINVQFTTIYKAVLTIQGQEYRSRLMWNRQFRKQIRWVSHNNLRDNFPYFSIKTYVVGTQ